MLRILQTARATQLIELGVVTSALVGVLLFSKDVARPDVSCDEFIWKASLAYEPGSLCVNLEEQLSLTTFSVYHMQAGGFPQHSKLRCLTVSASAMAVVFTLCHFDLLGQSHILQLNVHDACRFKRSPKYSI